MSKDKHLDYIQGVITRHNSNSFMLKGWCITITSALLALAGAIHESGIVLIAVIPIVMFWGLDAYYLSNERCFVDLFNAVAIGEYNLPKAKTKKKTFSSLSSDTEKGVIPEFGMKYKMFKIWTDNTWLSVLRSGSIFWFYFPVFLIVVAVRIFVPLVNTDVANKEVTVKLSDSKVVLVVDSFPLLRLHNSMPIEIKVDTVNVHQIKKSK
jgi:hypothetical protein